MNGYYRDEDIVQNLLDAGCDQDTIKAFMEYLQCDKPAKSTQLLQKHRCCLLNDLHKDQKRIDCLDYLLFMLKKEQENKNTSKSNTPQQVSGTSNLLRSKLRDI